MPAAVTEANPSIAVSLRDSLGAVLAKGEDKARKKKAETQEGGGKGCLRSKQVAVCLGSILPTAPEVVPSTWWEGEDSGPAGPVGGWVGRHTGLCSPTSLCLIHDSHEVNLAGARCSQSHKSTTCARWGEW